MVKKYVYSFDEGSKELSGVVDYNSHNTERLDVNGMKKLLLKLEFMQKVAAGEKAQANE